MATLAQMTKGTLDALHRPDGCSRSEFARDVWEIDE